MPCPCLASFTNSVNSMRLSSRRPKTGPLTKIAHPGSIWPFIHGMSGLTTDLPYNMAVHALGLSIFLLSQFPAPPISPYHNLVHHRGHDFDLPATSVSLALSATVCAFEPVLLLSNDLLYPSFSSLRHCCSAVPAAQCSCWIGLDWI
jgi:hypothetical protein